MEFKNLKNLNLRGNLQYEETMRYLNELLVEKVMKVKGESEAVRVWNYPYQALAEVVATLQPFRNAIFNIKNL